MKIYLVGGAVRDKLLGLPVKERDWVVVGASPDDMLKLGYRQVGKEFPVFLHPKTHEEYALARMERKTGPGYKGFAFDTSPTVTLEDDLIRRDLTINAMAETPEGELIDPYHGKRDLENKVLRHVSQAFSEDPVRILRVGRFLARYAQYGFHIAPETLALMQQMVKSGEVNALVAERVWKEWERALTEKNPEQFFEVLVHCGALPILFPELIPLLQTEQDYLAANKISSNPIIRFAVLLHDLPEAKKAIATISNRYRVPNNFRELAELTAKHYQQALNARNLNAAELLHLFISLDIFRREQRFHDFLIAIKMIATAKNLPFDPNWLNTCAEAAKSVDVQALIAQGLDGQQLADKLKEKRREKIEEWQSGLL